MKHARTDARFLHHDTGIIKATDTEPALLPSWPAADGAEHRMTCDGRPVLFHVKHTTCHDISSQTAGAGKLMPAPDIMMIMETERKADEGNVHALQPYDKMLTVHVRLTDVGHSLVWMPAYCMYIRNEDDVSRETVLKQSMKVVNMIFTKWKTLRGLFQDLSTSVNKLWINNSRKQDRPSPLCFT